MANLGGYVSHKPLLQRKPEPVPPKIRGRIPITVVRERGHAARAVLGNDDLVDVP